MFPIPWNFPLRKKNGNLVNIGDAIDEGTELPAHGEGDAGKVLSVDENGDLEWSDDISSKIQTLTNNLSDEVETRAKVGAHNLMPFDLDYVKSKNTSGSWSDNVYTHNGIAFTFNIDSKGNLESIGVLSNPSTGDGVLYLHRDLESILKSGGNYILNGVSGGTSDTYRIGISQKGFDENGDFPFVANFTITGVSCWIQVTSGATVNTTIYPMIRDAKDIDSTYQPYAMTNRELTEKINEEFSQNTATISAQINYKDVYLFTTNGGASSGSAQYSSAYLVFGQATSQITYFSLKEGTEITPSVDGTTFTLTASTSITMAYCKL